MPNCQAAFFTVLCILAFSPLKTVHAESNAPASAKILKPFPEPAAIIDPPWLARRQQTQLEAAQAYEVFCDFSFTDQFKASGIEFRNRVVEDSAKDHIPVHYDHGNGLAVGDVDGDGLYDPTLRPKWEAISSGAISAKLASRTTLRRVWSWPIGSG